MVEDSIIFYRYNDRNNVLNYLEDNNIHDPQDLKLYIRSFKKNRDCGWAYIIIVNNKLTNTRTGYSIHSLIQLAKEYQYKYNIWDITYFHKIYNNLGNMELVW